MTLKTGTLAYFDSMQGLVPCRVESITGIDGPASSAQTVCVVMTATRGPWKRGEHWTSSALWILPRAAIRNSRSRNTLPRIACYSVECDKATNP